MANLHQEKAIDIVQGLLKKIGFEAEVGIGETGLADTSFFVVTVRSSDDLSVLIGKNGQNLAALEHVARLLFWRQAAADEDETKTSLILDINRYRESRAKHILDAAKVVARRVISTQKAEAMLPMSAYERRLVHTELASYKELQTESIGEEPHRRVVIKPLNL